MIRFPVLGALALALGTTATLPAAALTPAEKAEFEGVIRDYLVRNPEVLLEAMDALEAKRNAEQQAEQTAAIGSAGASLLAAPEGAVLGNPKGDVTVVEFFDYNCGYCKGALADMQALIEKDPQLRFVLKEIPVLGDDSVAASRVSLAFQHLAPEKYGAFHVKLLGSKGVASEDSAIGVAEQLGVAEPALRAAMQLPEVEATIKENERLAGLLKINGTPSYVVANEVVPGALGANGLIAKIANVRTCGKTLC